MAQNDPKQEAAPIDVYALLAVFVDQLASVAWQKLGLQPDPITGKLAPDLVQAKVAIDATAGLALHLESQLDEEDRRKIHSLLRDLKVNYVQRVGEGST
jgi:hypothetical protein